MSGAMRKIGEYLGLLEDTDRYDDDYADYDAVRRTRRRVPDQMAAAARPPRLRRPRSRTSPIGDVRPVPRLELSRITTLHPRTYNEARTDRRELP